MKRRWVDQFIKIRWLTHFPSVLELGGWIRVFRLGWDGADVGSKHAEAEPRLEFPDELAFPKELNPQASTEGREAEGNINKK